MRPAGQVFFTLDVFVVFLDRGVYEMWCWHGDDMVLTWKIRTPWTFLWHVLTEVFLKCGVDMENTETLDIFVVFLDRGVPEMWC